MTNINKHNHREVILKVHALSPNNGPFLSNKDLGGLLVSTKVEAAFDKEKQAEKQLQFRQQIHSLV